MKGNFGKVGRLAFGPEQTAAEQVFDFVYQQLLIWRSIPEKDFDKHSSETAENMLTVSLVKHLKRQSRELMFTFFHQSPSGGRSSLDFAAIPWENGPDITVFEAKRLPMEARRQREYVSGYSVSNNKTPSGGIQRFKTCAHGKQFRHVGLIGYVQSGKLAAWHTEINQWIVSLSSSPIDERDKLSWSINECLSELELSQTEQVARASSSHPRFHHDQIKIQHLWVVLYIPSVDREARKKTKSVKTSKEFPC